MYLGIYKRWDAAQITWYHTHSGKESSNSYVPHMGFHSHDDSTVLRQVTCDTQKSYGHKSTWHPEQICYTGKQRGITFKLTHLCDRIFNFLLVALCLLASISDPYIRSHRQGINILLTLHAIPSTISWWLSEQPEDWIHPKSRVFMI